MEKVATCSPDQSSPPPNFFYLMINYMCKISYVRDMFVIWTKSVKGGIKGDNIFDMKVNISCIKFCSFAVGLMIMLAMVH
jgi:hypothetical protein